MLKTVPVVCLFTDGSCRGNPGPGGWAALLRCGKIEKELSGRDPDTTNNRMELVAVIKGLETLKVTSQVTIYTDSLYVQHGITRWINQWKKSFWKTSQKKDVKNRDLWERLDQQVKLHQVNWTWVKGHSGHIENERVDQLARRAITVETRSKEHECEE